MSPGRVCCLLISRQVNLRHTSIYWHRNFSHIPVMANDIVRLLRPEDGKVFIDMTFGSGGHSKRLLDSNKSIKIVAVDRDPVAYQKAQKLAAEVAIKSKKFNIKQTVIPIQAQFSNSFKQIHLQGIPYASVNGVIFDLGASSMQFDDPERGFSLSSNGPLDMRMDTSNESSIKAEDVVNNLSQEQLALIFKLYGQERRSRKIASAILDARNMLGRIKTTHELAKIISTAKRSTVDSLGRHAHGGTKIFQALRIFVNNELNELNYALEKIREFLIPSNFVEGQKGGEDLVSEPYGVAAVLTFHSLEDSIVKRQFTGADQSEPDFKYLTQHDRIRTNALENIDEIRNMNKCKHWRPLLTHVKEPSEAEILANPRSRSAKLRAALRID